MEKSKKKKKRFKRPSHVYSRRILAGLAFSCVGDAFLQWPGHFLQGMGAFGLAQICYCMAFGLKPLNLPLGVLLYTSNAFTLSFLIPGIMNRPALLIGLPVYCMLLTTMAWRAIARVQFFQEFWTWTKLCACLGSLSFVISDSIIGFDRFYSKIPNAQVFIMLTYYAAQLGIALSVVDSCHSASTPSSGEAHTSSDNMATRREQLSARD